MDVISLKCACGHAMKFAAEKAGKKAKCPKCAAIVTIAKPDEVPASGAAGGLPSPDDEEGSYGLVVDHDLEERRRRIEEEDRLRAKEAKKKKAPKLQKKFKSLPDAEQWQKVHFGLLFLFLGSCVWAFTLVLQGMWVALGTVEFTDYARLTTNRIAAQTHEFPNAVPPRPPDVLPERGGFWDFSQFHFLVAMAAGRGFVSFAKFCIIVNLVLYPLQTILWFVGYILCLPVPRHHGTFGMLILLMILSGVNFLVFLFFRVLPVTGLYSYFVIPYFIPELMFTEYNMSRVYPFFMLWSPSPFWETLLALFLQLLSYLEPIIGATFCWSCVTTLKAPRVESNAHGVTINGFCQYYIYVCYVSIALCGTTPVLVAVLRVLYLLWFSALMMFIVRYALLVWRCRELLASRLHPEG